MQSSALTFSKKIPEGPCNPFQVNDLTFERNTSEEGKWALPLGDPSLWASRISEGFFFFNILRMTHSWVMCVSPPTHKPLRPPDSPCQSTELIWNAVIWLDRNRSGNRVQRRHCVSATQTDCGRDLLCEASMFTLCLYVHTLRWPSSESRSQTKKSRTEKRHVWWKEERKLGHSERRNTFSEFLHFVS